MFIYGETLTHIGPRAYISERWFTNSCLDRVVASNDFHNCISKIDILYDVSDEDHISIKVYVNSDCIPNLTTSTSNGSTKLRLDGLV